MPTYSSLSVYVPSTMKGGFRGEIPAPIRDAGLFLNHAILLAEMFGIDAAAALESVNQVHGLPEGIPHLFIREDHDVMVPFLGRLLDELDAAVDSNGRPRASTGASTLLANPLLRRADDGALVLRSHDIALAELRERVAAMRDLFAFARDHGLLVRME
jgi:hypothetical protein